MAYITCCLLITLALVSFSAAYPWADNIPPPFMSSSECNTNDETEILCQRCAKSTKSPLAYPMCCGDKDGVRNWCLHYITFGIQGE